MSCIKFAFVVERTILGYTKLFKFFGQAILHITRSWQRNSHLIFIETCVTQLIKGVLCLLWILKNSRNNRSLISRHNLPPSINPDVVILLVTFIGTHWA